MKFGLITGIRLTHIVFLSLARPTIIKRELTCPDTVPGIN